jgi:hypothetical protein
MGPKNFIFKTDQYEITIFCHIQTGMTNLPHVGGI